MNAQVFVILVQDRAADPDDPITIAVTGMLTAIPASAYLYTSFDPNDDSTEEIVATIRRYQRRGRALYPDVYDSPDEIAVIIDRVPDARAQGIVHHTSGEGGEIFPDDSDADLIAQLTAAYTTWFSACDQCDWLYPKKDLSTYHDRWGEELGRFCSQDCARMAAELREEMETEEDDYA